jgi:hypothetical protein
LKAKKKILAKEKPNAEESEILNLGDNFFLVLETLKSLFKKNEFSQIQGYLKHLNESNFAPR